MAGESQPALVYYVEDDANIRDLTLYALKQASFEGRGFAHADGFFAACREQIPQLVLLDIMLPDIDGLQILDRIRRDPALQDVPVIMLTAKGTEYDTVSGLDAGADDYLAKPFSMVELVSRSNALLRRARRPAQAAGGPVLVSGPIALDTAAHSISVEGRPVDLTLKEFELLKTLMENAGRVLSRAQLFEAVWGSTFLGGSRTVDVHMQTLRQKLDRACPQTGLLIETVRGVGYRFKA